MSNYDHDLEKHYLKELNDYRFFFSPIIQNEFIYILGNHVNENILDRFSKAKYFLIILDSTPDISHTD